MSTLWTPSGEHRVPRPDEPEQARPGGALSQGRPGAPSERSPGGRSIAGAPPGGDYREPTPEEVRRAQEKLDAMRAELLEAPVEVVIANHAMGIWELAALHLSNKPPQLAQAQLAIDALAALVDGLHGRLGEAEKTLSEGLAQIRMAYVHIHRAEQNRGSAATGGAPGAPGGAGASGDVADASGATGAAG